VESCGLQQNRDRLLNQDVAREFFCRVLAQANPHLSDDHFSVDGTLIEEWASQKSFQKKDGGDDAPGQFRGERRSNDTHESKTDPEARLYLKGNGQEAKLGDLGHVLMENHNGMIVDAMVTQADGTAEREATLLMLHGQWRSRRRRGPRGPMSVGAKKAYDTRDFVSTVASVAAQSTAHEPGMRAIRSVSTNALDREGVRLDEANRRRAAKPSCAAWERLPGSSL
jgi:hypothetical protein